MPESAFLGWLAYIGRFRTSFSTVSACRVTQDDDVAVAYGCAAALVLEGVMLGASVTAAVASTVDWLQQQRQLQQHQQPDQEGAVAAAAAHAVPVALWGEVALQLLRAAEVCAAASYRGCRHPRPELPPAKQPDDAAAGATACGAPTVAAASQARHRPAPRRKFGAVRCCFDSICRPQRCTRWGFLPAMKHGQRQRLCAAQLPVGCRHGSAGCGHAAAAAAAGASHATTGSLCRGS